MTKTLAAACFAAVLASACSPQPTAADAGPAQAVRAVHPESGLPIVPLAVTTSRGRHEFRVEVAATAQEQARGLMFRTALGPDEGMLFPRNPPDIASFWMKNTPLPLDIIFIGTDGRVLNVAANTVPYSLESVSADGMTAAVLELNAGRAAALGIGPGAKVTW
ncbi:DUF192 domain-containing protein [Altererythrobacter aerius]|uniref:DUF192 domain-containing protein n=1 Tax=Tsuneonella aeria TaxID=1837929 RepID=A0A6I4TGP8_9SPHN|nr:DUF192 domain-containing protein [Tsuneonella aeria]MXO75794.1 DUF192 domain-containing protein [Tsuneonella aeria]